jgi:hypothetical protein
VQTRCDRMVEAIFEATSRSCCATGLKDWRGQPRKCALSILCHFHGLLWKRVSPNHSHRETLFREKELLVRDGGYSAECTFGIAGHPASGPVNTSAFTAICAKIPNLASSVKLLGPAKLASYSGRWRVCSVVRMVQSSPFQSSPMLRRATGFSGMIVFAGLGASSENEDSE